MRQTGKALLDRLPGVMVGVSMINRGWWLSGFDTSLELKAWWAWAFTAVGVVVTAYIAAGMVGLREPSRFPWVAYLAFVTYAGYATWIWVDLGWDRVRGTSLDLYTLALLIAWQWGGEARLTSASIAPKTSS